MNTARTGADASAQPDGGEASWSGGLEIRSGGLVAVDTASLEAAASALDGIHADIVQVADLLRRAAAELAGVIHFVDEAVVFRAWMLADHASRRAHTPSALAGGLRASAALFDVVELQAQRAAAMAGGDAATVARLDGRLAAIEVAHPGTLLFAAGLGTWRELTWPADVISQVAIPASWLGPVAGATVAGMLWSFAQGVRATGVTRIAPGARLSGTAEPVRVREVPVAAAQSGVSVPGALPLPAAVAPTTLAGAADRIPTGAAAIRVERYTLPDGTRQFAVYIAGTRSGDFGGAQPFDALSDVQLAAGQRSSSYDAVLEALADAGAQPGDVVHAIGHSQGAMIGAHLAVDGGYDVRTLVSLGSPVDPEVGDATLSVTVRHSDDPIAALAGGGRSETVGAPGSFVAERTADPALGVDLLAPHHLTQYTETAAMLDASADPRMDAVREVFAELGDAASVEVTEYRAERVSPSAAGEG